MSCHQKVVNSITKRQILQTFNHSRWSVVTEPKGATLCLQESLVTRACETLTQSRMGSLPLLEKAQMLELEHVRSWLA